MTKRFYRNPRLAAAAENLVQTENPEPSRWQRLIKWLRGLIA